MDGILVVDKPSGLTSHDVVAVARRALGQQRIGHTGTLDPLATGVLPLACGRATRLVRFLSASEKAYAATIQFGLTTDTFDVLGRETSRTAQVPALETLQRSLDTLHGSYLQLPPAHSAKKIGGQRAYTLARQSKPVTLAPVPVTVRKLELLAFEGAEARIALVCSAGFYVRSFAHRLGELTGTGACLQALTRTRSGEFTLQEALTIDALHDGTSLPLIPLHRVLLYFQAISLTDVGRSRVTHGQTVTPAEAASPWPDALAPWTRLLDSTGALIALAQPKDSPAILHPAIVLT